MPDDFNFGFDVVDAWADIEPEKLALVWTNDAGDMARYTFKDVKDNSNRAVNFLLEKGIKKGDIVMLVLKQRPEVWFIITALHKIGATVIPATTMLFSMSVTPCPSVRTSNIMSPSATSPLTAQ